LLVDAHNPSRGAPGPRAPGPRDAGLADTVAALRDEIRGLRSAARMRAVIEQAKGVLVERHRISLDEAFDRLRTMSQEHNVRLVEVAATVVGVAVPTGDDTLAIDLPEDVLRDRLPASPAASRSWRSLQEQPDVRAGVVAAVVDSMAGSTSHGDEAAHLLAELLSPYAVSGVTLYRASADDSLRLIGQHGVPGDLISSWRSIPPSRDIPYIASLMDRRMFLWGTREERHRDFPGITTSVRSRFVATGTVPVVDGETTVGVVGLMWDSEQSFDEASRAAIQRTIERVSPLLLRNASAADPELDWLNTLLRLHLDPWLLLETIPSADGVVRDFVVQDAAPTVPEGQGWVGRRLLELWPSLTSEGVSRALAGLAQSGGSWSMTVATPSDTPWGIPGSRVRAVRLGRRIALVWRPGRLSDRRSGGGDEADQGEGGLASRA
jgi:hypothetical protein